MRLLLYWPLSSVHWPNVICVISESIWKADWGDVGTDSISYHTSCRLLYCLLFWNCSEALNSKSFFALDRNGVWKDVTLVFSCTSVKSLQLDFANFEEFLLYLIVPEGLWIQARMDQASGGEDPNKPSKKKSSEDEGRNKKLVGDRAGFWVQWNQGCKGRPLWNPTYTTCLVFKSSTVVTIPPVVT